MWLRSLDVLGFLGFKEVHLDLDRPLTVLTGPNGAGKSTVLHCLRVARDAVRSCIATTPSLSQEYANAGYDNAERFEIRLRLHFDRHDEQRLIDLFYRAAIRHGISPNPENPIAFAAQVAHGFGDNPSRPIADGTLIVAFDAALRSPWQVAWEFATGNETAHLSLRGQQIEGMVRGSWSARPAVSIGMREIDPTGSVLDQIRQGGGHLDVASILAEGSEAIRLAVAPANTGGIEADDVRELYTHINLPLDGTRQLQFAHVIDAMFARRLQLTNNSRLPPSTTFAVDELFADVDLSDGSRLAVQLFRWKNGGSAARQTWQDVQRLHSQLIGSRAELVTQLRQASAEQVVADVVPVLERHNDRGRTDVPSRLAGAGEIEALLLAALLVDGSRCVVLDEPAVYLSPVAQRRLLSAIAERSREHQSQVLLITHNADLVPASGPSDLDSIVRLHRSVTDGTRVAHLHRDGRTDQQILQRLRTGDTRALLFAAGVVLTEGETEVAALPAWLDAAGARSPEQMNVSWFAVGSDTAFGPVVQLLDQLEIPWVILADGPALRSSSKLNKHLRDAGYKPPPTAAASIAEVRDAWNDCGVYSLATTFGDDGSKAGEIEAFFDRVDPQLFAELNSAYAKSKPRLGAMFAELHPEMPGEVSEMWAAMHTKLAERGMPT